MIRSAGIVLPVVAFVTFSSILILHFRLPLGPLILVLSILPLFVIRASGRTLSRAVPDLVFGSVDTGLLTIPAILGGLAFGVAGAVAGGVVGDAITDAIAGLFEGHVSEWLRSRGFEESREAVTTSLGKMSGCLFGSGLVLTLALVLGFELRFG
ncbi:MAG: hypothetical protein GTO42_01035 [Candidatus Latescibacteria bacterium]|nr:hypothetical protein [Candidatus Latescibacterota bacterium]NIO27113.1 hypothetical protein [Candidatus Latescibacterota bacterium]NIO54637.1 hypothetical protein [Candidatus Latescibacterota bacterium]NIT00720.1 hypothetical protein [Candidatus Latescibacterota bacterium]NIT37643.1 hypothetical protein [Candidatus Latescibacterota bacterium]